MGGYFQEFQELDLAACRRSLQSATSRDVERVLSKDHLDPPDFSVLFSPAADSYLERIAQKSAALTERRFGKVIVLYAPIYLSSECINHCIYCGFSKENEITRVTLTLKQAVSEAEVLRKEGFHHLLLVSGESPRKVGYHYLSSVIREFHKRFSSLSLEIYPLDTDGYRRFGEMGVDGLTLYQETYDTGVYKVVHPKGPKRDFAWRLDSQDRAGQAGYRSLGIGALLGLSDWRFEALMIALHGRYLTRRYWKSRVAVSFPRFRFAPGGFCPEVTVTDRNVVQMLCGLRLLLPDAEMVLSTREQPSFRDNFIGLGVTRMSAGSKTNPGGYGRKSDAQEQFRVEDTRSPAQVARFIAKKGFEPVWKDFDREYIFSRE